MDVKFIGELVSGFTKIPELAESDSAYQSSEVCFIEISFWREYRYALLCEISFNTDFLFSLLSRASPAQELLERLFVDGVY